MNELGYVLSCPEQERTKEVGIGGALNVVLPRAKDAPSYVPPPSRTDNTA